MPCLNNWRGNMCIKVKNGARPNWRAWHKWTSIESLNKTLLHMKCGREYKNINLKGVHISKLNETDIVPNARLLRVAGERFMFFVDASMYGVTKLSRLRGGYYHYIIDSDGGGFIIQRFFYSKRKVRYLSLDGLLFHNKMWLILNSCFYGGTAEGESGGDNSS